MILQGRNLTQGLSGPDVAALHGELTRLGYTIPPAELQASQFGPATLAALQQAQADKGAPTTTVVDASAADALTAFTRLWTFSVSGHVTSAVSAGLSGLGVRLVDKNVGGDVVLASASTDANGAYAISLVIGPPMLRSRLKLAPDLQTQVIARTGDAMKIVAVSPVAIGAKSPLVLDIALPDDAPGLPSEYETLTASLSRIYGGRLKDLKENDQSQDVTFLGAKSGWDARAVAMASLADQFSTLTTPQPPSPSPTPSISGGAAPNATAAPTASAPPASLRQEFYYALFRAGLPADADALFRIPPATVSAIWTQAAKQGVIPPSLANAIPDATKAFETLAGAHLLTMAPKIGLSTLSDLVAPTLTRPGQSLAFANLLAAHLDDWPTLWTEVGKAFGPATAQKLQLIGKLSYLTLDNAPLLAALGRAETQSPLTAPIDLAVRGYWDPGKWTPLIGQSVPAGTPGATPQEQATNYASWLAAQVRLSFPTATLAQKVKSGAIPLANAQAHADEAADFLAAHQAEFVFGVETVDAYIARNNLTPSKAAVYHLRRLQRAYQMTSTDHAMSALLASGIDSAFAITRYDADGFARAFGDKVGGADAARAIHARARQIHGVTLNVATSYATQRVASSFGRASGMLWPSLVGGNGANGPKPVASATLENLFGSLDTCGCDDCESLLSPAAYLVDLLHYLDQPAAASGANPQTILFGRRPDLQFLPLTCENTDVALPYIDVVNETLEYFVANALSIEGYQGFDTGDKVTSAELVAAPQNVNDAAYVALQGAFFPAPLPFNRRLALLRGHLNALRASAPDVMEALRKGDRTAPSAVNGVDYSWNDILIERLGMSRDELRVFVDPGLQLGDLVGLANADALGTLQTMSVHDLVRRAGISYDNLVAILQTQFVNPAATLIPRLQKLGAPFATIKALRDNPASAGPLFIAALPADLDFSQYGGPTSQSGQDVVSWLISDAVYLKATHLITISNPTSGAIDCSGAQLQLRYANPDMKANLLSGTDWLKIVRFIRLWRKMEPLLGGGDAMTILQTDALLAALYPAASLPSSPWDASADATNRPLLDAGFLTAIRHAGFLFQAISLLGLDANSALSSALTCVAPIGTTGSRSFYQSLFGSPTLASVDPGAQIAVLTGTLFAGDTLRTFINGVGIDHVVSASETPAMALAAIAAAINGSAVLDTASGAPIGGRFHAAVNGTAVAVTAGFVVTVPAPAAGESETLTLTTNLPTSQSLAVGGAPTPGDVVQFAIDGVPVSYLVAAGDTLASIADGLRDAVNATTVSDPSCGAALNTIVAAASANGVVDLIAAGAGAPFTLACSTLTAFNGAYVAAIGPATSVKSATVSGAFAPGAALTTTINGAPVVHHVAAGETAEAIAAAIVAAVNGSGTVDPVTGLAVSALVSASQDASVKTQIDFAAVNPTVGFALAASATTTSFVAGRAASPFEDDGYGDVLTDPSQKLLVHEPFLCAACSLTGAEFSQIVAALGFDLSTPLSLENVSAIYHNGWLAHTLGLSVLEFLRLKQCSGLDPFASLDPGAAPDITPPLVRFIRMAQTMTTAGLDPVQALFLVWNEDVSGTLAPQPADIAALALALRKDFAAVEANFARKDDPDGSIARALMALVYGAADSSFFFSLVSGAYRASVSFANASPLLPQTAVAAAGGRLSYDDQNKLLTATSFLDPSTVAAIKTALTVNTVDKTDKLGPGAGLTLTPAAMTNIAENAVLLVDTGAKAELVAASKVGATGFCADLALAHDGTATPFAIVNDPSLPAAIDALGLANQQAVAPFFARYPELRPLYDAFVASSAPLADRYNNLLDNFLPVLKSERKVQQALADISAGLGQDASFAAALLQDARLLHASSDPAAPAIADLTGVETGGLTASIHLDGDPASTNPQIVDVAGPIKFAQVALLSGAVAAGVTLTTTVNGAALTYVVAAGDVDLPTLAGNVAKSIGASTAVDPKSGLPVGSLVVATAAGPAVAIMSRALADQTKIFTLDCASSSAALGYVPTHGPLSAAISAELPAAVMPAASGAAGLAISLAGYIVAPQDGLYNISVVMDAGATAMLTIGGASPPLRFGAGAPPNIPIHLSAGALTSIVLKARNVATTLTLSWQSPSSGQGWQPIPSQYLFSQAQFDRLRDAYVRFLKATSLASALSLTANEMAFLAYDPAREVATSAKDKTVPGPATFHPASMANVAVGTHLAIDSGAAREIVEVVSVTPTSFDAHTMSAHDGSASAFSIRSAPSPDIGRGWLNTLPGRPYADQLGAGYPGGADGARLGATLAAALDFARLKKALSPSDERLLQTLVAPAAILANGRTAIAGITGWATATLNTLLMRFTGSTSLAALSDIEIFARVFDGAAIIQSCRVSAPVLLGALSNAPTGASIAALQSALRAQYAAADWLAVVKPINDALRDAQRDALVAFILQGFKSKPPAPPYNGVDTPDKLFEFFLMDVENEPAVLTSRIRLALSSTQLFVERVLRGLETQTSPGDIDAQQWTWMKRYRVWQANREVFLWPENWLYPELRDDQSPMFKKTLSALLQSDLTDDAAATAYLSYLSQLELVAKLEPCGIYYIPASDGSAGGGASDEIAYVVARTSGAHRKHFFRRLEGGSWTPWEEVKIDCEDMPLTPIVWNGRLFLFWLRILKGQSSTPATGSPAKGGSISGWDMSDVNSYTGGAAGAAGAVTIQAVLCWSEYYNGAWQDMKTSDVNRPADINVSASAMDRNFELDRNRLRIVVAPYREYVPSDALVLAILPPSDGSTPVIPYGPGFVLHNTHSLPTNSIDIPSDLGGLFGAIAQLPLPLRTLKPSRRYSTDQGSGVFSLARYNSLTSLFASNPDSTSPILGFPFSPRYIQPQIGPGDSTGWPFFYEDKRNQFYVTIQKAFVPYHFWDGFAALTAVSPVVKGVPHIPPLVTTNPFPGIGPDTGPYVDPRVDPASGAWTYAGGARNVVAAFANEASFAFQGRIIGITGGGASALRGAIPNSRGE